MNNTTFFRVSLFLVLLITVAGCRKKPKSLTQIPGGSIVGGGSEPVGLMDYSNGGGAGNGFAGNGFNDSLDNGQLLAGDNFPNGSDVNFSDNNSGGSGGNSLPDRNLIAGASEDRETLAAYTVFFDYDRFSIRTEELAKVEAVADFLAAETSAMVKIEGHCDERGTEEYNRSLGERRALSVREVLVRLGIAPDRVTTESWGEDRPAVEGENENAYRKNRRGEFVILRQ